MDVLSPNTSAVIVDVARVENFDQSDKVCCTTAGGRERRHYFQGRDV